MVFIQNNCVVKKLIRSCVVLITKDSVPLNAMLSPNMRSILDPLCDGLRVVTGKKISLNSRNCRNYVNLVANEIKKKIEMETENKLLSLKINSAK